MSEKQEAIDGAIADLNKLHQDGRIKGLMYIVDTGAEKSNPVCLIDDPPYTLNRAARYFLHAQGEFGPIPPGPWAEGQEFLDVISAAHFKHGLEGIVVIAAHNQDPESWGTLAWCKPEVQADLTKAIQAMLLKIALIEEGPSGRTSHN